MSMFDSQIWFDSFYLYAYRYKSIGKLRALHYVYRKIRRKNEIITLLNNVLQHM